MLPTPVAPPSIPADTSRVAMAIFPEGHLMMRRREALGPLFQTADCAPLCPALGQPALAPARRALVTVWPCLAGRSDRHAAAHVRRGIDGPSAVALPREDPGFEASVWREWRTRLSTGPAEPVLCATLLLRLQARGWLKARGRPRTDATPVLAAIRTLHRLTCVGETVRQALHDVAPVAPAWLQRQITPDGCDRSRHRLEDARLPSTPEERHPWAVTIGRAGGHLLTAVPVPTAP